MHVSVESVMGVLGWHYLFSALHQSAMGVLESCLVRSDHLCLGSLLEKVRRNMLWCLMWWKVKIINNIFILWVSDASTSNQKTSQSHSFRNIISLVWLAQKLPEQKSCSSWILNVKHKWQEISLKFHNCLENIPMLVTVGTEILKMRQWQHFQLAFWALLSEFSNSSYWPLCLHAQQIYLWLATMIIASRSSPSA